MPKESYVRDSSGNVTHVDVTTDDGKTTYRHEANKGLDALISGAKGPCVEVTDHNKDGTSKSYEADNSILGTLFGGGKGKEK